MCHIVASAAVARVERCAAEQSDTGAAAVRRQQIIRNLAKKDFFIEVELAHLAQYDAVLQDCILQTPNEYIPVVRAACHCARGAGVEIRTSSRTVRGGDTLSGSVCAVHGSS